MKENNLICPDLNCKSKICPHKKPHMREINCDSGICKYHENIQPCIPFNIKLIRKQKINNLSIKDEIKP